MQATTRNVAIVTGAGHTRGMGAAFVRKLAAGGYCVLATDVAEEADETMFADEGDRVRYKALDVTSEEQWESALEFAQQWGPVCGLVNNAAFYEPKQLDETTLESFEKSFAVNQLGAFLGMRHCARAMRPHKTGSIVNISSTAGLKGSSRAFAYCATKGRYAA